MRLLTSLRPGDCGVIARVNLSGRSGRRLMAIGLLPGREICFLRRAPLGDPLLFQVAGSVLSLRKGDAELVELTVRP